MNVELIKMDKGDARAKLAEYRKAIAARHHSKASAQATREYEEIANAYRVAARGFPLIELSKAMAMGGWDELGRPRFAVHRADLKTVNCSVPPARWGTDFAFTDRTTSRRLARHTFKLSSMPARPNTETWSGRAIVPLVPPGVLPRPDTDLSKRVILWEANWTDAPVDPLLLLPIGGDLYAVEGAWDLSPLERAVIAGTRA